MKAIGRGTFSLFLFFTFSSLFPQISLAGDTITSSESLTDGQDLISSGGRFKLSFFSPGDSTNRYLGICYNKVSVPTYVWVANRETPLTNTSGVFQIDGQERLVILNESGSAIWSFNLTHAQNPVIQLLDNGNLVVREETNRRDYLWQSFDYPSDTLLPGMKLGWNLKTGLNRFLTSWRTADDPSPGDYTFKLDLRGWPEAFLLHRSTVQYRSGPWNGIQFSGVPEMGPNYIFNFSFVSNQDEVYYAYDLVNSSLISRLLVNYTGFLQRYTWIGGYGGGFWNLFWWARKDQCDDYVECGDNGICNTDGSPVCECVKGFEPRNLQQWYLRDGSDGCKRKLPLGCEKGDGFYKLTDMKLPDSSSALVDKRMSLRECKEECLRNCSCTAYSNADIRGGGSGCVIWSGNLVDLRQYSDGGQDLYVRLPASELGDGGRRTRVAVIVSVTLVAAIILSVLVWYFIWRKKKMGPKLNKGERSREKSQEILLNDMIASQSTNKDKSEERKDDIELPFFDLCTIVRATNNFSDQNKLGEGGFGPVYKGKLPDGHEIAVKRLSKKSVQGVDEFKNEVLLIVKLQHRNLVRLLGCCTQGEETMLIYEYMHNRSLDSILFDEKRRALLDWRKRFNIILGIARGLLYLHQDSRFKIIHRDLKASNVLLDSKMDPKISDFGTARIFGGDQVEASTTRVVGTYGYMSPEYAMDGLFSEKSDVFSFGVLVLEILSGKKNRGFFHAEEDLNLLGHAWRLWKEGKSLEMLDTSISFSCPATELLRCIQVGLLCVQERAEDRPSMSTVVLMLGSENPTMLQPKQPGFCPGKSLTNTDSSSCQRDLFTVNEVTVTTLDAR